MDKLADIGPGSGQSADSRKEDAIAALFVTNPQDDRQKHITYKGEVTPGTCTWIDQNGVFLAWKNEIAHGTELVWLSAGSGKGKTMLSIFVTQRLEGWVKNAGLRILLYYFCDGRDEGRNTAIAVLRSLIYQMICYRPNLVDTLLKTYSVQRANLFRPTAIEPLWQLFETMVQESNQEVIYCLIDGADECEVDSLHHLLKKIRSFFERAVRDKSPDTGEVKDTKRNTSTKTILRMMIVSREEPACLKQELSTFSRLELGSGFTKNESQALNLYAAAKAREVSAVTFGSKVDEGLLSTTLGNKAEGNFLWVNVATEALKKSRAGQINEQMQHLPSDVSDMYAQILLTIPSEWIPTIQALLKWILVAIRPLTTAELSTAIQLTCGSPIGHEQLMAAVSLCGSLLVVQRQEVLIAHQSVYDFFLGAEPKSRTWPGLSAFMFRETVLHSELTNLCIKYLESGAMVVRKGLMKLKGVNRVTTSDGSTLSESEKRHLNQFPLMNYAVLNWPNHARMGNAMNTNYASSFFAPKSEIRDIWWETHWLSTKSRGAWRITVPHSVTPLHIAAVFGIIPLALYIESKNLLWDAMQATDSHMKYPIDYAVTRVRPQMTSFLLDRGTLNIPFDGLEGMTMETYLLSDAVQAGEAETVKFLLEKGGNPDQKPYMPEKVSDWARVGIAAALKWKVAVDMTAEQLHWSDVRRASYGGTNEKPLHFAAAYGNYEVCEVLIKHGAKIDSETDTQWQPIHNAAWYGFPEIIKLLIRHGVDPEAQSRDLYTPLHCAVSEGHKECVIALLDLNVALEIKNSKGRVPLHVACKAGHLAIVELLIEAGADINALDNAGGTPLILAAANGQNETIEDLLDHGADINIKKPSAAANGPPISAFDVAKSNGHKSTMAILTAQAQGQRVPKKRPSLPTQPLLADKPFVDGSAESLEGTPGSLHKTTSIPKTQPQSPTGPDTTDKPGFKYPPPPPLLPTTQPVVPPQSPPLSRPVVATFPTPSPVPHIPSVNVSLPPPPTSTLSQLGEKLDAPPALPPRPASSHIPVRPSTNQSPPLLQPATVPATHGPFPPPPPQGIPVGAMQQLHLSHGAPSSQPWFPPPPQPIPPGGVQSSSSPPQIHQPYQAPPPGYPSQHPQVYPPGPVPQAYAPGVGGPPQMPPFPANNAPGYYPGPPAMIPSHPVRKSRSFLDINVMGRKII